MQVVLTFPAVNSLYHSILWGGMKPISQPAEIPA